MRRQMHVQPSGWHVLQDLQCMQSDKECRNLQRQGCRAALTEAAVQTNTFRLANTMPNDDEVLYVAGTIGNTSAVSILSNHMSFVHNIVLPVPSPLKNSSTSALSAGSSSFS